MDVDDIDHFLDFLSDDDGEEVPEDDEEYDKRKPSPSSSFESSPRRPTLPELEEDLEWLSNKDVFPAIETCLDILPGGGVPISIQKSPVSVLGCGGPRSDAAAVLMPTHHPVRVRSKRRRKWPREFGSQQWWLSAAASFSQYVTVEATQGPAAAAGKIGRTCQHCGAEKTPQWRAGPEGPKTLCNACGVRYKSGRLVPEYRPARSPTFSNILHSNSHRKILEMRRQKEC